MSIVTIKDLTLRIPTRLQGHPALVHAVTDVSMRLEPGRVHALVGESGCGKSVLASTLNGLLPPGTQVTGGVTVAGVDVAPALGRPRHSTWRPLRGRVVGSVAQSSATAFTPNRTIGSQLAEAVDALDGVQSPKELAATTTLPPWALDAYPHELSGGLIGRAALAAALAGQPRVLVADEPTAALDPALAAHVLGLLRTLADEGVAVLLITHDLGGLLDGTKKDRPLADEISVMYAGRIVEQGPADTVLGRPAHAYPRALLAALPRNGLHPVPGAPPALTNLPDDIRFEDRLAHR